MRRDPLLGFEQHLYLRQPGYGASYITGGRLMEEVIAERARQLGDAFTLQRVIDEINAAGMIPPSLIYWEADRRRSHGARAAGGTAAAAALNPRGGLCHQPSRPRRTARRSGSG